MLLPLPLVKEVSFMANRFRFHRLETLLGEDTKGMDLKAFGDTTGKYVMWDASADTFYVVGALNQTGNQQLTGTLTVGVDDTGHDVTFYGATSGKKFFWDESADTAYLTCTVDIDGTVTVGVDDTGYDVTFFGATSGKKFFWDESGDTAFLTCTVDIDGTVTVGVDDTGYDVKFFGATASKYWLWDESEDKMVVLGAFDITGASQFTGAVTVGVDDTGHDVKFFGATAGKYMLWDESADALIVNGIVQVGTTVTAALAMGGGTSSTKLTTATADKNFLGFWTESTAASGDSRGMYLRHYLGGTIATTGYGDAVRAFTTVTGTGYSYASGIHATMQINAAATVTGSGSGGRFTLAAATETRTLAGAQSSIHLCSDIATGNTLPTVHGWIRCTDDGSVRFSNFAVIPNASNGTVFAVHTTQTLTHSIKIISEDGTAYYIMCTNAATNRS